MIYLNLSFPWRIKDVLKTVINNWVRTTHSRKGNLSTKLYTIGSDPYPTWSITIETRRAPDGSSCDPDSPVVPSSPVPLFPRLQWWRADVRRVNTKWKLKWTFTSLISEVNDELSFVWRTAILPRAQENNILKHS